MLIMSNDFQRQEQSAARPPNRTQLHFYDGKKETQHRRGSSFEEQLHQAEHRSMRSSSKAAFVVGHFKDIFTSLPLDSVLSFSLEERNARRGLRKAREKQALADDPY